MTSSSSGVFLTVLKSCLAQCLLSVSQGEDLNCRQLGEEISQAVSAVITSFEAAQSDLGWKRLSTDVVKVFLESLRDITEVSSSLATGRLPWWVAGWGAT